MQDVGHVVRKAIECDATGRLTKDFDELKNDRNDSFKEVGKRIPIDSVNIYVAIARHRNVLFIGSAKVHLRHANLFRRVKKRWRERVNSQGENLSSLDLACFS